jgi:hypothetical protein
MMAEAKVVRDELADLKKMMLGMQEQILHLRNENAELRTALEPLTQTKAIQTAITGQQRSNNELDKVGMSTGDAVAADEAHKIKLGQFGYQHSEAYYAMQNELIDADKPTRAAKDEFLALADHEEQIIKDAEDGMLSANQLAALIHDERKPLVETAQATTAARSIQTDSAITPVKVLNADGSEKPEAAQMRSEAATPKQTVKNTTASNVDTTHQNWIQQIADMPDKDANAAILAKAQVDGGKYGSDVVKSMATKMAEERAGYIEIKPYDNIVGAFVQNNVSTTASFGPEGYTGQLTNIQQQLKFIPSDFGAFFANASVAQNQNANVTGGNLGVNWAGTPFTLGGIKGADFIPIANLNINFPAAGDFGAENVSGLAGVVIKPHEGTDRTNLTLAVISNGKFDNMTGLARVSKQLWADDVNTVTGYAQSTYTLPSHQLDTGAGLRYDRYIGDGNSLFIKTSMDAANVTEDPGFSGNAQFGFAWGGAKKSSELEERLSYLKPLPLQQSDENNAVDKQVITQFSSDKDVLKMQQNYNNADETEKEKLLGSWSANLAKSKGLTPDNAEAVTRVFLNIPQVERQQMVELER